MASLGDIVIGLRMDNRQFTQAASSTRGTLSSIGTSAMGVVGQLGGMLGVGGALASIGWGVKLAADAEQTQIAFEVMLGSADHAKAMLADLKDYAAKSPFDVAGTNEAAKKLLNYGLAGDKVLPTIKMLGDVASGDMDKFDRLSTAFGQMSATGRLMGQDLLQFINAGFNPLQEISKKTGESMRDLKARMEAGGISSREVAGAFQDATSEGGRFFGMTERQSKSIAGKFSTLKDAANSSLREIGESLITNLNLSSILDHITGFVQQVPFLFRNAGSLIEIAVLDWQIYLYEFFPAAENVMMRVGAVLNATWEASIVGFQAFVKNLLAGLVEIRNLALATWESIKAGIAAIGSGKNPLTAAGDAFVNTLANQKDADGGKGFAQAFQETFSKTMADSMEGLKDQGGLTAGLKSRRDSLLNGIGEREFQLTAIARPAAAGGSTGTETEDEGEGDGKKKKAKADKGDSKAALVGSSEAAATMLRGLFGPDVQKQQLAVQKQQLAEQKKTNANAGKTANVQIANP